MNMARNAQHSSRTDRRIKKGRHAKSGLHIECLEQRHLLAGQAVITEFMAKNDGFWEDGDGNAPDWIEIQNVGDSTLDLVGYRLTDDAQNLSRWTFPSASVEPGEYLVVFASGQEEADYVDAEGNLHTNFGLSASGEYVALVAPDGSIVSEYGTAGDSYPEQRSNISYGVAQRRLLLNGQSDAMIWQPLSGAVDATWKAIDFDAEAHGFLPGKASIGFEDKPDSRSSFSGHFLTDLPSGAFGAYSRVPFTVENTSEVTRLNLRMRADNGFVAYLNGVKVAESNAPNNPQWFSTAPNRSPSDSRALDYVEFDLTAHVGQLVDGNNVLAIHGLNHLSDRDDMLIDPELVASIHSPDSTPGYMTLPTPGAENAGAESLSFGVLGTTEIQGQPGFYDAPFSVTISTESPDAEIRYTTDGSPPTATSGTAYSGPIVIGTTTTLRAASFQQGHVPSNVATQTYLFLDEVIRQPQEQPGLPTEWLWTEDRNLYPADYEMDQRIVNDPAYRDEIIDSLKSLRTMSVVMDPDDLFGPAGMINNTELHGRESEHPISLEILNPDGSLAYQENAGIRIHGNFTRHYNVTMKQSFRLTFRGEYGATSLEYPLFPDSPADNFDNVIVHAGKIRDDAQLVSNTFGRDTNLDMGNLDAHSTYVHLYLNGLYWGLYNPFERPDGQFAETYLGGRDSDYDSILNITEAVDGSTARFASLVSSRTINGLNTKEEYEDYLRQVDLDSLIDFLLINQYMAHGEHEFRALGKREGDADFRFMIWDVDEMALTNVRGREDINTYFASGVYEAITRHPEMRLRYADRIHKHLFNGGALTPESAQARWEGRAQEIRSAVVAESARWGDMRWGNQVPRRLYTRDDNFDSFGARLAESYFPERTDNLLSELKSRWDVYPDVMAPEWNQLGGPVSEGFELTMTDPNSRSLILYTLDGTDPRQYGGEIGTNAIIHDGSPVPITGETTVKARVYSDGEWSALMEGDFLVVGADSPFHIRVTEVNYHPHDANQVPGANEADVDNTQFEFIELTNTSTATIDITGLELARGAKFTFPENSSLAAGQQVLVVSNLEAFESRYGKGLNVAGEFESVSLLDVGGLIDLRDAGGRRIQSFSYEGHAPWPGRANGGGSSLEIIDPLSSASKPTNWRASSEFGGSPGAISAGPMRDVAFTEVVSYSTSPDGDMVELYNALPTAVDISGWYVSNSSDDYLRHEIPAGTVIPASSYHVLTQSQLGFDLNRSRGDKLWLVAADSNGKPRRFVDHVQFGPSGEGVSMGPGPDTQQTWLPLAQPTFGSANSSLAVGDVIITELHYAPIDPDGDRRLLKADNFEFIELYNTTDTTQDLSDWKITGDIELTLPAGTLIDPAQSLVIVPFDPSDVTKAATFRVLLNVDSSVPLLGPYSEPLDDAGGTIRLERPELPEANDPTFIPFSYVDEIEYETTLPWPQDAVGTGASLSRLTAASFGKLAASWNSAAASPGVVDFALRLLGDSNQDGRFDQLDLVEVLQGAKYQTGQPASFREGDWNADGVFDQSDLVAALQTGNYLGPLAALRSSNDVEEKNPH